MSRAWIPLLAVAFAAAARADEPPPLPPAQARAIDAAVEKARAASRTPAISVAVARRGAVLYAHGYGLRDAAHALPATPSTVYEIGSVTKQFTAACVLLLARDGKLALHDPLARWLPDAPHAAELTLRHLLTQQSGLHNYTDDLAHAVGFGKKTTPRAIAASVAARPLAFTPGTRFEYSNTNYLLLGLVVEKVAGVPYARFLAERVLAPLGLRATAYTNPAAAVAERAVGYTVDGAQVAPAPAVDMSWPFAAGALSSTVLDLARWDGALAAAALLTADELRVMTTPAPTVDGRASEYAMGWVVDRARGRRRVWHNGGIPGFSATNVTFPDDGDLEIIVLANLDHFDGLPLAGAILDVLQPPTPAEIAAAARVAADEDPKITARAKEWITRTQSGDVDRAQLGERMNATLTPELVRATATHFAALGAPRAVVFKGKETRGTVTIYSYRVAFAERALRMRLGLDERGRIVGLLYDPGD